ARREAHSRLFTRLEVAEARDPERKEEPEAPRARGPGADERGPRGDGQAEGDDRERVALLALARADVRDADLAAHGRVQAVRLLRSAMTSASEGEPSSAT